MEGPFNVDLYVREGAAYVAQSVNKLAPVGGKILQNEYEAACAARLAWLLKPKVFVEIGCAHGGTLWLYGQFCTPGAKIIAIDPAFIPSFYTVAQWLRDMGHYVHPRIGRSELVLSEVQERLEGQTIDLLHIDGDHSYDGCMRDWAMYEPLVSPGGVILIHDIINPECTGVGDAWAEIKEQSYRWYSLHIPGKVLHEPDHPDRGRIPAGYGIIWKKPEKVDPAEADNA